MRQQSPEDCPASEPCGTFAGRLSFCCVVVASSAGRGEYCGFAPIFIPTHLEKNSLWTSQEEGPGLAPASSRKRWLVAMPTNKSLLANWCFAAQSRRFFRAFLDTLRGEILTKSFGARFMHE